MLALDLFRFNSRLKTLTFAIGICVAFIVGSFAFANGLGATVKNISDRFVSEGAIAYEGGNITGSIVDLSSVYAIGDHASIGLCTADVNGSERTFFAVNDPSNLLQQDLVPLPGEMRSGTVGRISGLVNISASSGTVHLYSNATYSSPRFPAYWHLIRWDDLVKLRPEMKWNVSFILYTSVNAKLVDSLRSEGLTVQEMTGILGYFNAGSAEVANDLWLIVVPASFIVALLVYSAVAMETKDRAREIAILKAMGANNRQIGGIFLFQALIMSVLGALVGIMIGIIVSYAISTSSSVVISNSVFLLKVTEFSMLVAFASAVVAGVLGSIMPIYRASHESVREALR